MLIAIEGIDGSGKGTVTKRLQQEAGQIGWKADQISFPRYESTLYGDMVGRYLNGTSDGIHTPSYPGRSIR